jgi:hypothetical protein
MAAAVMVATPVAEVTIPVGSVSRSGSAPPFVEVFEFLG